MTPAPTLPLDSSEQAAQRIAIVTRRFWPISGATEHAVADLAVALTAAGHSVEIFTIRWGKSWPTNVQFREIPVRRVPKPSAGPWGSFRYLRNLSRHIADFQPDGILAYGAGDEIWSVARTFARKIPVAIRMDHLLIRERAPHIASLARRIETWSLATSILTDSDATSQLVTRTASETESKIRVVPDAIEAMAPIERSVVNQSAARSALCDAHPVLMIESGQPLVVCGSSLDGDGGVFDLVRAWPSVLERFPKARLWILGDGRCGKDLWDEISSSDLVYSVIMPGFFDSVAEIFQAANLYVHPLRRSGHCNNLVRAMLAGVGVVGTKCCETPNLIQKNRSGLLVEPENPNALAEAIIHGLSDPNLANQLGRAARQQQLDHHQSAKLASDYVASLQATANPSRQALK